MRHAALPVIAALALAACQHRHLLSTDAVSGFADSGKAMLVLDGDMTALGCGSARYNFSNRDDQSTASLKSEAGAGTIIVTPGRYVLNETTCAVWGTGGWVIPAAGWFSVVDVKLGEIVYLGTMTVIPFGQTASAAILSTPEMKASWAQVPTYTIKDERDAAVKVLRPEIGPLVDRMVTRLPSALLSESVLADVIRRAYQPDASGIAPPNAQAEARAHAEWKQLRFPSDPPGGS